MGMSEMGMGSLDIRTNVAFYCTLIFGRLCLKLPLKHNWCARVPLVRIVFKSDHVLFRYSLLNRRKKRRHGWPGQRNLLFMTVYEEFLTIFDFLIRALLSGVEGTPLYTTPEQKGIKLKKYF